MVTTEQWRLAVSRCRHSGLGHDCAYGASAVGATILKWLTRPRAFLLALWLPFVDPGTTLAADSSAILVGAREAVIVSTRGRVELRVAGRSYWEPASIGRHLQAGDECRVGADGRVGIVDGDREVVHLSAGSHAVLRPASNFELLRGVLHFFHRDRVGGSRFKTPATPGIISGTEFVLEVDEASNSILHLIEGEVTVSNRLAGVEQKITGGITAVVTMEGRITTQTLEDPGAVLGWCTHFPPVLLVEELELTVHDRSMLSEVLEAVVQGDLVGAALAWPKATLGLSADGEILQAQLLLAISRVDAAEALLARHRTAGVPSRTSRLADALTTLIDAIIRAQPSHSPVVMSQGSPLVTELLAESYLLQSRRDLKGALSRAQAAKANHDHPNSPVALVRSAELHFGEGDLGGMRLELARALASSPMDPRALVLEGFVEAARNRVPAAADLFDRAIHLDPSRPEAWLGRGLCRIKLGENVHGLTDLEMAASLGSQRGIYRSYLAKGFAQSGNSEDLPLAVREIALAKERSRDDPTPWFYSALIEFQEGRINEAVQELEHSQELAREGASTDGLYRSSLMLDQDRAVRGANLARLYGEAGLEGVAFDEASRAVAADYQSGVSHLFLANAYSARRDPQQVSLRYDTAWYSEYLLANLLLPVGAGPLSPTVSQQEYSRMFETDELHLSNSTEYRSSGDLYQNTVQYGTVQNTAYSSEVSLRHLRGPRVNGVLEDLGAVVRVKQQASLNDTIYLQTGIYELEAGDVGQHYPGAAVDASFKARESQEPSLLLGYNHEWRPGSRTLLLAGWLADSLSLSSDSYQIPRLGIGPTDGSNYIGTFSAVTDSRGVLTDVAHLLEVGDHSIAVGMAYDTSELHCQNTLSLESGRFDPLFLRQDLEFHPSLFSAYAYDHWRVNRWMSLVGGLTYQRLVHPINFRFYPLDTGEGSASAVSPHLGLLFRPDEQTGIRLSYSETLTGVGIEQNTRLEPASVGGFTTAFRSVLPEAVVGTTGGESVRSYGISLRRRFKSRTHLALSAERLESRLNRHIGGAGVTDPSPFPISVPERMQFAESRIAVELSRLLDDVYTLGSSYQWSLSRLSREFPSVTAPQLDQTGLGGLPRGEASLHQITAFIAMNHPSGFFGRSEAVWNWQLNGRESAKLGDYRSWQMNLLLGYRFWHRRGELTVGVFNIAGRDYLFNPISVAPELPHQRTLATAARFSF